MLQYEDCPEILHAWNKKQASPKFKKKKKRVTKNIKQ